MKNAIKPSFQVHSFNSCLSLNLGVVIPMTEKKMRALIAELQMMLANKVEVRKWRRDRERLSRSVTWHVPSDPIKHKHKWKPLSSDAESNDICKCGAEKSILGKIYGPV